MVVADRACRDHGLQSRRVARVHQVDHGCIGAREVITGYIAKRTAHAQNLSAEPILHGLGAGVRGPLVPSTFAHLVHFRLQETLLRM